MVTQKSRLLKSHYYNYNAEFRRTRRDKGKKRGFGSPGFRSRSSRRNSKLIKIVGRQALTSASSVGGEALAAAGGAIILSKLQKGKDTIGTTAVQVPAATIVTTPIKPGQSITRSGTNLLGAIGGRLSRARQRIQRGINTYQDVSRLPITRQDKLLAGLGLARQVGGDIFRGSPKSVTRKRK